MVIVDYVTAVMTIALVPYRLWKVIVSLSIGHVFDLFLCRSNADFIIFSILQSLFQYK